MQKKLKHILTYLLSFQLYFCQNKNNKSCWQRVPVPTFSDRWCFSHFAVVCFWDFWFVVLLFVRFFIAVVYLSLWFALQGHRCFSLSCKHTATHTGPVNSTFMKSAQKKESIDKNGISWKRTLFECNVVRRTYMWGEWECCRGIANALHNMCVIHKHMLATFLNKQLRHYFNMQAC